MLSKLRDEMKALSNPERAKILSGFFKTDKGEYGEGDLFIGLTVPQSRAIAKKYSKLSFADIKNLLQSKFHEERLVALLMLVHNYQQGDEKQKTDIFNFYLDNIKSINNWDLVDLSADKIVGSHLLAKDKDILYNLAKSNDFWKRRIAIISTFHFIKQNQFNETLKISEMLLLDKHDLIHKAVGWMLREIGKRDQKAEETFLKKYCKKMHRTTLRYAIERFNENKKKLYMKK